MFYEKKKRKFKDTKTTEILDFVSKEIDYKQDKERDKQSDMKEELEYRYPFQAMKDKMDRMQDQIKSLREAVMELKQHQHADGKVVSPLKEDNFLR